MSLSLPPELAEEYRNLAREQGKTASALFREIFAFYRQEKLKREYRALQEIGSRKVKRLNLSEREIERLIFEGR